VVRTVGERYFSEGAWRATGPLALAPLTCLACGHRAPDWAAFRAHRAGCPGRAAGDPRAA